MGLKIAAKCHLDPLQQRLWQQWQVAGWHLWAILGPWLYSAWGAPVGHWHGDNASTSHSIPEELPNQGWGLNWGSHVSHRKDAFFWIERWMGADGTEPWHHSPATATLLPSVRAGLLQTFPPCAAAQLRPQRAPSTNNTETQLWSRDRKSCNLGEETPSSSADILCPWRRSCGCQGSWARHQWSRDSYTRHTGFEAHR